MTKPTTIHTERIDGKLVGLPVNIEQPDIKAALDKLIGLSEARREAFVVRDTASNKLAQAMTHEADDIARAMFDDLTFAPEGVAQSTLEAQEVARNAQTRLNGIVKAQRLAVAELDAAIEAHGAKWARSLRERGLSAVLTVTTALDMAVNAKAALDEAVGVLIMLKRRETGDEPATALAMGAGRYVMPLDAAIDSLRAALIEASREVEAL